MKALNNVVLSILFLCLAVPCSATITRISVNSDGMEGNNTSMISDLTPDARYVLLNSVASNLVPGDMNGAWDVFVYDRQTGAIERVSVDSNGIEGNGGSGNASISADGRYVAFSCKETCDNLVPGDTNMAYDIFVHDRQTGITERVNVDSYGAQAENYKHTYDASISADGRYVAFATNARNLVVGDTNNVHDIFVHDRQTKITERVSMDSYGSQGNKSSFNRPSMSADGRYVAFLSSASNLIMGDTNGYNDFFVHDRQTRITERVSVDSFGNQGNGHGIDHPVISADGRYVVFVSYANNLVSGDNNGMTDAFIHDRQTGTTELVSVDSHGIQANSNSSWPLSISSDGRYVAFQSAASNLVEGDTNNIFDVFVHDRRTGITERVSEESNGLQANCRSLHPAISHDGRYVGFDSCYNNFVPYDTNMVDDVFVVDRDQDSDGLLNHEENNLYHTNPGNPDTDGDGYSDGEEVNGGSDPLDRNSPRVSYYCGDGIVSSELGEVCDSNSANCLTADGYVGTQVCVAQCSGFGDCVSNERCGDGILNGREQCDGMAGVGLHQECSANCTLVNLPYCGDGMVNGSEQCDGAAGVGLHQECSASCLVVNLPYCGDGVKNGLEECDGTDGVGLHQECSASCTLINLPYCGDGIVNGSEQCDGSAGVGLHQECSANCTLVNLPYCGDGIVNGAEQCDGLSGVGLHQECSADCVLVNLPYCGDSIKNSLEECDGLDGVGAYQECSTECKLVNLPYCGDGIINGSDQCDGTAGVGEHQECTNACLLTSLPYCGDGIVNGTEQCDGVAGIGSYQECSVDCTLVNLPYCGDGIVNGTEQCDGLAGVGEHQECTSVCTLNNVAYCGDGVLNGTEECDGTAGVGDHQECLNDCTLVTLPSNPEFVVLTQSHTVYTGSNVTFNVVAQDANGYDLDLQVLEALPKNAVFSSDSTTFNVDGTSSVDGTFSWTPSSRQTGTYTLHFEAGDTSGTASVVSDPVTIKVVKPTTTKTRR